MTTETMAREDLMKMAHNNWDNFVAFSEARRPEFHCYLYLEHPAHELTAELVAPGIAYHPTNMIDQPVYGGAADADQAPLDTSSYPEALTMTAWYAGSHVVRVAVIGDHSIQYNSAILPEPDPST